MTPSWKRSLIVKPLLKHYTSLESEKELDEWLLAQLEMAGKKARIDFEAPDKIVVIEMVQNECGVGLITKEMKERFTFIKIK